MSAALVCDGPGCSRTETDPGKCDPWWRLERQGPADLTAPARAGDLAGVPQLTLRTGGLHVHVGDEESGEAEVDPVDDGPVPVLHFCSTACLAAWCSAEQQFDELLGGGQ